MKRVFVSYRRNDTAREAHVLKRVLEDLLRDVAVFIDTDDIPAGSTWPERLERELDRASAVILLIGPDWRGANGADRIADEGDWVRREIEIALTTKAGKVLPVIVEGATAHLRGLPTSLHALADLQHETWQSERWEADMREIVGWAATALDADLQLRGEAYPEPDEIKRFFTALDAHELEQLLASGGVDGWTQRETVIPGESVEGGQELYKVFEFRNFRRAFTFMQLVAIRAEQFNHHPDWRNVWNRVFVSQRTWDAQHVITGLDFQMASYMNRAAAICNEDPSPNWPPRAE